MIKDVTQKDSTMMRRSLCAGLLLSLTAIAPVHAALESPSDGGGVYYKLGGGEPLMRAPNRNMRSTSLGASLDWSNAFSCSGSFDPMATVSNQLNGVTSGFTNLMGGVISNARGAVAGLAALAIQRANPALYDLLQKGIVGAKTDISFAEGSCEDMQNSVASGGKGLDWENWVHVSALDDWRRRGQTQQDVIKAKEQVDNSRGDNGAPWINGNRAGGTGQQPIRVNRDVTAAGYNLQLNRSVTSTASIASTSTLADTPLASTWKSPAQASQWAVDVLGDTEIRTCGDCEKKRGVPGKGLVLKYEAEKEVVRPLVANLVSGTTPLTAANLEAISAPPNLVITKSVIESLQNEKDADLLASKLAAEIALTRTMNRALLLRRVLESGKREPNVGGNGEAQAEIQRSLADLDGEMKNLLFEMDVRERLASNTPSMLLERQRERQRNDNTVEAAKNPVKDGEIKP